MYSNKYYLPPAEYTFEIDNNCGDPGDSQLSYNFTLDGEVVTSGADFGYSDSTTFGSGCPLTPPLTNSPTPPSSPCTQSIIQVGVLTDEYPGETSWTLFKEFTGDQVASSPEYVLPEWFHYNTYCLSPAGYTFDIKDDADDGICCSYGNRYYNVTLDGEVVVSGADFGYSDSTTFGTAYCSQNLDCSDGIWCNGEYFYCHMTCVHVFYHICTMPFPSFIIIFSTYNIY